MNAPLDVARGLAHGFRKTGVEVSEPHFIAHRNEAKMDLYFSDTVLEVTVTTVERHAFMKRPRAFPNSCLRCGRPEDSEIHKER